MFGSFAVNLLDQRFMAKNVTVPAWRVNFVGAVRTSPIAIRQGIGPLVSLTNLTRLVGIGEQLVVGELALGAVTVLLVAPCRSRADPQHAKFALHRNAAEMGPCR